MATKSGSAAVGTIIRLGELQAWPALESLAPAAVPATSCRSASANTMKASEPPSSNTDFFRFLPAVSATAAPARSLPVRDTPWTRGSAIMAAT